MDHNYEALRALANERGQGVGWSGQGQAEMGDHATGDWGLGNQANGFSNVAEGYLVTQPNINYHQPQSNQLPYYPHINEYSPVQLNTQQVNYALPSHPSQNLGTQYIPPSHPSQFMHNINPHQHSQSNFYQPTVLSLHHQGQHMPSTSYLDNQGLYTDHFPHPSAATNRGSVVPSAASNSTYSSQHGSGRPSLHQDTAGVTTDSGLRNAGQSTQQMSSGAYHAVDDFSRFSSQGQSKRVAEDPPMERQSPKRSRVHLGDAPPSSQGIPYDFSAYVQSPASLPFNVQTAAPPPSLPRREPSNDAGTLPAHPNSIASQGSVPSRNSSNSWQQAAGNATGAAADKQQLGHEASNPSAAPISSLLPRNASIQEQPGLGISMGNEPSKISPRIPAQNLKTHQHNLPNTDSASSDTLKNLPEPLLLLLLSSSYVNQAKQILPLLGRRPPPSERRDFAEANISACSGATNEYTRYLLAYRRLIEAAALCCRRILRYTEGISPLVELRARSMLAEILVRDTDGSSEAEQVISKGLIQAQKHESFTDFKYTLYELQIELLLSQRNVKFAKSTAKRCIKELSSHDRHPAWLYRFHLLHSSICIDYEGDFPSSLASLREAERLAQRRGDEEMRWAIVISMGRISLLAGELKVAEGCIEEVASVLDRAGMEDGTTGVPKDGPGPTPQSIPNGQLANGTPETTANGNGPAPSTTSQKASAIPIGRQLKLHYLLLYCIFWTHKGDIVKAKSRLKEIHVMLDDTLNLEEGEEEGWVKIGIRPRADTKTYSPALYASPKLSDASGLHSGSRPIVVIATIPRMLLYTFTFLVSIVVYRDPVGKAPRGLVFGAEGMRATKIRADELDASGSNLAEMSLSVGAGSKLRIDMVLFHAEFQIMRSNFSVASELLDEAISRARGNSLWSTYAPRITFAKGLLFQGLGNDQAAIDCFRVAGRLSPGSDVATHSNLSEVLTEIGRGATFRASGRARTTGSPIMESAEQDELNVLKDKALAASSASVPSLQLAGQVIEGLTCGEIVKSKQHLSNALTIANSTANNHMKALLLALLANLFLLTRNDQATKMLHSAYVISRGMGGNANTSQPPLESSGRSADVVGNPRLGLWIGEQLLEVYRKQHAASKIDRQSDYNEAHRQAIIKKGLI